MPAHWHEIGQTRAPDDPLNSRRAQSILAAIDKHEDFTLVETRLISIVGVPIDIFIVACICDGVPSKNEVGILYEEPLAILVSSDPSTLPQVRALRRIRTQSKTASLRHSAFTIKSPSPYCGPGRPRRSSGKFSGG